MSPDPHSPDPSSRDPLGLSEALARDADAAAGRPVDLDAVLRGSRDRRRQRRRTLVTATASVAGLLVVGALAFGVGSMTPNLATTAGSSAEDAPVSESADGLDGSSAGPEAVAPRDGEQFGDDLLVVGADSLNRCGAPIAPATDAAAAPVSIVLVAPAGPVAPGAEGVVRVRLVNEGTTTVEGSVRPAPAVTVSDAGTTVWHPSLAVGEPSVPVRLAPGEQLELEARFAAASCTAADERAGAVMADLPPLDPGAYELSAVVPFVAAPGSTPVLIVSPTVPVTVG
ncbi:hypothetical protein [Agromyces aureus]|uniref:Uncharacterized protein n=1 Tax=Agromyces aureus TaxID=453304 RepID=A0A191WH97_9MICO|nr:hypothetical protein [Agromyces aureus]ANJ27597.1 hypothetical protein ATC03_13655 [Agromyces aureus]